MIEKKTYDGLNDRKVRMTMILLINEKLYDKCWISVVMILASNIIHLLMLLSVATD